MILFPAMIYFWFMFFKLELVFVHLKNFKADFMSVHILVFMYVDQRLVHSAEQVKSNRVLWVPGPAQECELSVAEPVGSQQMVFGFFWGGRDDVHMKLTEQSVRP